MNIFKVFLSTVLILMFIQNSVSIFRLVFDKNFNIDDIFSYITGESHVDRGGTYKSILIKSYRCVFLMFLVIIAQAIL